MAVFIGILLVKPEYVFNIHRVVPPDVLVLHRDCLIPCGLPRPGKGQAALLGLVGVGLCRDDRVEHHDVFAVRMYDDDPLSHADHVPRHAHAAIRVGGQRVLHILRQRQVVLRRFH